MIRILKEVAFRFGYKCNSFPDPLFSENRIFPENTSFFHPFSKKNGPVFREHRRFFHPFFGKQPLFSAPPAKIGDFRKTHFQRIFRP